MPRRPTKPKTSIFHYSDFRHYIRDRLAEMKKLRRGFTARHIAERAGFGSPSFLKMIMDGKRKLTDHNTEKLCDILEIHDKERAYFTTLSSFNQEVDPNHKHELLDKLEAMRPRVAFSKLENHQHKFLSKDYYACVREMILLKDFNEDPKWIAAHCVPRITPTDARDAIDTLLEIGLIKRDETGKLVQSEAVIDTGMETKGIEAFNYHESILNKARTCLSIIPAEERSFTALTIPMPLSLRDEIIKKISNFQEEILDLVNQKDLNHNSVFQLSMQFFPVTLQTKKEGNNEN